MYEKYIKRLLDLILSSIAIILCSPLILMISLAISISMGTPIFFNQKRVGKDENIFIMYKFRTMNDCRDIYGQLLPDELRITKLGKFLRGTSLDELPELFNIFKGDISIIGPRPLLVEYLPYYTNYERNRHKVRGGLTVPEVLYDNFTPTWEEQFKYEVDYVNNVSFILDAKIFFKTITGVFKRKHAGYGNYIRQSLIKERWDKNINARK